MAKDEAIKFVTSEVFAMHVFGRNTRKGECQLKACFYQNSFALFYASVSENSYSRREKFKYFWQKYGKGGL